MSAAEKHLEEMMRDCCYHEAAHAVFCVSRGVELRYVEATKERAICATAESAVST